MRIAFLLTTVAYAALVVVGAVTLPGRLPLRSPWVNLPHKDWWTATPEREERARRRLSLHPPISACCAPPAGHPGCVADAQRTTSTTSRRTPCQRTHLVTLATPQIGGSRLSLDLYAVAAAVMVLLVVVLALTLGAAHSDDARLPGGAGLVAGVVVAALGGALALMIWMPIRYRPEERS